MSIITRNKMVIQTNATYGHNLYITNSNFNGTGNLSKCYCLHQKIKEEKVKLCSRNVLFPGSSPGKICKNCRLVVKSRQELLESSNKEGARKA